MSQGCDLLTSTHFVILKCCSKIGGERLAFSWFRYPPPLLRLFPCSSCSHRRTAAGSAGLGAVLTKRSLDAALHALGDCRGASQHPFPFLCLPRSQMAGAGLPMHSFAGGRKSEPLLGSLVGLLLRHNEIAFVLATFVCTLPARVRKQR